MNDSLTKKRQLFHRLLILLGEEAYKAEIIFSAYGVESTKDLNSSQLDKLITAAQGRIDSKSKVTKPAVVTSDESLLKAWRNKCLLVLNERGISATPSDWSAVNSELAKKQYQWITPGSENKKGLMAFRNVDDLKKLFRQLVAIRNAEKASKQKSNIN